MTLPAPAAWAGEVLDGLRGSLAGVLAAADRSPCFLAVVPGTQVVADHCGCGAGGCGMGWVRAARVYHSARFPTPDSAPVALDVRTPLVMLTEVGVLRCQPAGHGRELPTAADQVNAALDSIADMQAVHDAITCCAEVTGRTNTLGGWTPVDGGACGGGYWQVTVQLRPARNPVRS